MRVERIWIERIKKQICDGCHKTFNNGYYVIRKGHKWKLARKVCKNCLKTKLKRLREWYKLTGGRIRLKVKKGHRKNLEMK
jgi:hypothetical protein